MTQLNIHMTKAFEHELLKFMKIRHISTKSEAIRIAIREGLAYSIRNAKPIDFSSWIGFGNQVPTNKKAKFRSDDDLWR